MPIDYSKAKIYKLTTINNPDLVYYGSTINELCKRKSSHKSAFKIGNLSCQSSKLFELGIDDVEITLIECINCNNKEELLKKECFYIENNKCVNKNIPLGCIKNGKKDYSKYVEQKKNIKIQCEICPEGTMYSYYNKTHHLKSRVHQSCQKLRESL